MLNFSRLSRRTHRIVNALISWQYRFMTSTFGHLDFSLPIAHRYLFDAPARVRKKDIVQPGPVVLNELDAASHPVGRLQDGGQRLLRRLNADVQTLRSGPDGFDRGLPSQRGFH